MPRSAPCRLGPALLLATAAALPALAQDGAEIVLDTILLSVDGPDDPATTTAAPDAGSRARGDGLDALLRGMAGVTTQGGTAAAAETAVNIRGLQDNGRVAVTIDGARQNFGRAGHGANGTFAIDPEMLREVSVTRGPGAAAGAIAGAVALRTVSAADLIPEGASAGGETRLRWGDMLAEPTLHVAWAQQISPRADLTFAATRARAADYHAGDGTEIEATQASDSLLAKAHFAPAADHELTFTAQRLDKDYLTDLTSATPRDTAFASTNLVAEHRWAPDSPLIDLTSTLYHTGTAVTQTPLAGGSARSYDTTTTGIALRNLSLFDTGALAHELTLRFETFSDRVTTDDPGNDSLTPSGRRQVWSLSGQDRMGLGDTALIAGLSADGFDLTSESGGNSGAALSPRLRIERALGDSLTLHAGLAQGYRPPALAESLVDGSHPEPADFQVRPNPALEGEAATTAELGLRYDGPGPLAGDDNLSAGITLFRNRVTDYIEMTRVGGLFNGYYQYQNLARVRIEGIELEARYDHGRFFGQLTAQHLRGIDLDSGAELARTAPDRLVLTAGLRGRRPGAELGLRLTSVAAKVSADSGADSWTTLDLYLVQPLTDSASLSLGLNNLTDATYTPHLETRPAPGFNIQAALTVRF